jgi:hypothetical protein
MYGLFWLAILAQPAPEPAAAGGLPPEQVLASIDARGNLTITQVAAACGGGLMGPIVFPALPAAEGEKAPAKAKSKVKVTSLMVTVTEMPAKDVQAFTAEGRPISAERLATLLAKERAVLVALDGKKVDPFHLQLYKDDTIVLVPPANTVGGGGGFGGWGYGGHAVAVPAPLTPPVREAVKPPRKEPEEDR